MLLPIAFKPYVLEASNVPRFLGLVLLLLIVFVRWLLQKRALALPSSYVLLPLLAFYAWNLLGVCWSLNTADAVYECQKVLLVPCFLVLFLNWDRGGGEEGLVKQLVIVASLYLAYAVIELMQLPDLAFETLYGINSFSEHKNLLASFLFLLAAFPLYGSIYFTGTWKRFCLILLALLFLFLVLLQTRSVYLAMLVTTAVLLFFTRTKRALLVLTGAVAVVIIACMLYPPLRARLDVASYTSTASGSERLAVWSKTIALIKDHPLTGVGAGNWQYTYTKYGVSDVSSITTSNVSFQRPHNDLLWILSETGVPGLGILFFLMFVLARRTFSEARTNFKALLFFAFLAGLLTESFFSFPKERISHIFLATLLLALLLKHLRLVNSVPVKKSLLLSAAMTLLVFSLIVGSYRLKGEYHTQRLLIAKANSDAPAVVREGAAAISFFYTMDQASKPIYTYLGWAYNTLHKTDSMLWASQRAYALAPYDHEVLSNYGYALEKTGKRAEARQRLDEALRIYPGYEPALINRVILEYNARNYKAALDYLSAVPGYETRYSGYFEKLKGKMEK